MRRRTSWWSVFLALTLAVPVGAEAQEAGATPSGNTQLVTPGVRYRAGALHRFMLGPHYRDLWTTPIQVEVLDLRTFAGGLRPLSKGGGQQTKSLLLQGADGRQFFVRSVDKNPTAVLPPDLKETFAARVVQDQISSASPAGPLVVSPLLDAAGVLNQAPHLVVLPDDPSLGEFRAEFAGMLGLLEERTREAEPGVSGFHGATSIVKTDSLFRLLRRGSADRVDARAFLTARLMDVLLGDWDRHAGQWRWARFGTDRASLWQPIPDDRDQAFVRFDGFLLMVARSTRPQLVKFGANYPGMAGLTWNGRDLDRRLLTGLERPVWDSIAAALQEKLTDSVIDGAVAQLPAEHYRLRGAELATDLKHRRDDLKKAAGNYYRLLAREVDIHATDQAELVEVARLDHGTVEVRVSPGEGAAATPPYFTRRFSPAETQEIRVYTHGGADRTVVRGRGGSIALRVIGEGGNGQLDDSAGGGTRFYGTDAGSRIVKGPGTGIDRRPYLAEEQTKPGALPPRDWGSWSIPVLWASYGPDIGLFLGGGLVSQRYGFRQVPFASRFALRAGYATGARTFRAQFNADFRRLNSGIHTTVTAKASGIEIIRFHGFGNETRLTQPDRYYKVDQDQFSFDPSLEVPVGSRLNLSVGPSVRYSTTDFPAGQFITLTRPYGSGDFGQMGGRLGFTLDGRNVRRAATSGAMLSAEGRYFPGIWDVRSAFGEVHGEAAVYLSPLAPMRPSLALRVGGKKVWGSYPFQESAFIGGAETVRGFREQRFAGDASLYGNAELRLFLSRFFLLLPGDFGVFGLGDVGRVYLQGENSDRWHTGVGGGIWLSFLKPQYTLSAAMARSDERTGVYVRAGFMF